MGLAEKRAIKAFQEGTFKELETKILELVGEKLEIEIDWSSLAIDKMEHLYEKALPKVYFLPLISALENICTDDMGKEALNEGLSKIVIKNDAGIHNSSKWANFTNSILTLDHEPITNIDDVQDRSKTIQKLLEENL